MTRRHRATGWPAATPLRVAEAAARAGGKVVLSRLHDADLQVAYKDGRANIVTVADTESQRAVCGVIAGAFPDHAIIGEEGTSEGTSADHAWYVDPLDGTTNYAHGLPFFCVSVALRSHGSTVAGAVFDPLHDELFSAARAGGRLPERDTAARLRGRPAGPGAGRGAGADGR